MPDTIYESYNDLTAPQTCVMRYFDKWVHENKTPIPHKNILEEMSKQDIKAATTAYSLSILLQKGYIRRVYTTSNKSFYVMLRRVV